MLHPGFAILIADRFAFAEGGFLILAQDGLLRFFDAELGEEVIEPGEILDALFDAGGGDALPVLFSLYLGGPCRQAFLVV